MVTSCLNYVVIYICLRTLCTYADSLNLQNIKANEEFIENMFNGVHSIPSHTGQQSYYLLLSQCVSKVKGKTFAL